MQEEFVRAMRHLAYPVSIVSSQVNENRFAITVSSVTSVSVEPPSLSVCISSENSFAVAFINDELVSNIFLESKQKNIVSICSSKEKVGRYSALNLKNLNIISAKLFT